MTKRSRYTWLAVFGVIGALLAWGAWHPTPGHDSDNQGGYAIVLLVFLILLLIYAPLGVRWLVAWFRSPKPVASPWPAPTDKLDGLLRQLGERDIYIITAMQGEGIDPNGMTKGQLLAEVERAAKDFSERKSFEPLVYTSDGQRRLPFFTSSNHADTFIGAYSKERNRVYPFQLLSVKGSLLAQVLPACDVLVMNDRSEDELELTQDAATAIRRMWG